MAKCRILIDCGCGGNFRIDRRKLKTAAEFFAAKSAARSTLAFREVTVVLQDDEGSDEAHRAIMDVCGATDVITQRYDAMPGEAPGVYGELYVNVERAASAAPSRPGWNAEKELLLYVAHGMDHLSGEDDLDDAGRMRMRRRELKWLREFSEAQG
ncbi:MAG: rRNA maturation RNase YbeY [Kiritimatiellae bacterium]|nr:rRNA maturation RNase YbeY [Kiritimatiellia bacterium]